ncbi:hypothetical protein [Floridanema evergladense]|uniref:DUF29 domain-containing protein n=1 Tax=Floridaenema evergladense BLCC-F167 TaxID=3153639 RepID=A0ABV4WPZ1_9CYAN
MSKTLYETDYLKWIEATVAKLRLQNYSQEKVSYTLAHHRDEAIMVTVAVPGERWEVEF